MPMRRVPHRSTSILECGRLMWKFGERRWSGYGSEGRHGASDEMYDLKVCISLTDSVLYESTTYLLGRAP